MRNDEETVHWGGLACASLQTVRGDLARLDDVLRYEPDARAALAFLGPRRTRRRRRGAWSSSTT